MSLWDDFKETLASFGRIQASGVTQFAAGQVEKKAVQAGVDKQAAATMAQGSIAKATGQEVDGTTGLLLSPLEQTTTTLDRYVYSPTYEAAGFASLVANPDSWSTESGQRLSPVDALSKAWDGRREISLGKANADLLAQSLNRLPDWGPLAELNKVDIDIYNADLRDRIYERHYNEAGERVDLAGNRIDAPSWVERAFRGFSMTTDTAKQLILDPLWFAGKSFKGFRLSKLDKFRPEAIVDTKEWNKSQELYGAAEKVVREEKLKLIEEAPELERATVVLAEMRAGRIPFDDTIKGEVNTVREARGLKPYSLATPKEVYIKDYEKYVEGLKKKQLDRQSKVDDLNKADAPKPVLAVGVSDFVDQIVERQMNWREIERHRTLLNFAVEPEFLAKALAEAGRKGKAAVTDVLLLAQAADPSALIRLQGQHSDLLKIIDRAQTKIDNVEIEIQRALDESNPILEKRLNRQKKELFEYVQSLKKEDEYLTRLTSMESSIVGSLTGVPVSVSPIIEKFRADAAIVSAGIKDGTIKPFAIRSKRKPDVEFDWTRVQRGPLHSATYVAQWVGHRLGMEKPSGLVTVEGLDKFDGVKEFRTYLDNTPVLAGMVTIKNAFMDEYMAATDSLGRKKVLEEAEKAIVYQTAKRYGLHEEMTTVTENGVESIRPSWEVIYEGFRQERALAVEAFKRDKVFAVDQNNTLISNPVLESQLEYAVPMLDNRALDNYFYDASQHKDVFRGTWRSIERKREQWVLPAWKTFDTLWRADVLLRLGYPQRNVMAEWLVLANYDNGLLGMFSIGSVGQAGANFAKNRWSHFQDIAARYQAALDMADSAPGQAQALLRSLTPKQVSWTDYEKFASDQIEILRQKRQGIFDFAAAVMASPDFAKSGYKFPYEELDVLDQQILREEQKLAEIAKRVEAKGERFGKKNIRGKGLVRVGAHEFAGVFDGQQGMATEKLTSSSGRMAFDRNHWGNALKEMGLERTGNFTDIHPSDDAYFGTLASIINQQFQGSRVAMMIISGRPNDEILAYLATPSGRKELERLNWNQDVVPAPSNAPRKRMAGGTPEEEVITSEGVREVFKESLFPESTPENYIDFVKFQVLERYLPNDALKELVRTKLNTDKFGRNAGTVTSADLRIAAGDTQLNPIHGEQLEAQSVMHNRAFSEAEKVGRFVNDQLIKRLFRWLGEYPEDAFVSHPFADSTYQMKLKQITDTWEANGINPTNEDILQAQTVARKFAVQQSREYLYRVVRKNSIASAIPVLAPFFQAQFSTFKRVGKLSYRNPDKSARVVFAWNQINTHSYQDEDGQRWYTVNVPSSWYDDKGLSSSVPTPLKSALRAQDQTKWNVNSFNLLLAGLRMPAPDVLPGTDESTGEAMARWAKAAQSIFGVGPIVQLGANQIIAANPHLDETVPIEIFGHKLPSRNIVEIFASPYPSVNWWDPLLSGWNKRVGSLVFGEGNNDFERTQLVMFQARVDRQRTGEEPLLSEDPQENADMVWDLASQEASAFIALRLVVNLTSAFIPSYEGPMSQYVELYRAYQTKWGVKAYDEWLKDYPDMGYIAISRSQNLAGSSATTSAVALRDANSEMIEQAIRNTGLPREEALSFVQMITNGEIGAEVLRDPYASTWQKKKGDRLTLSAEEGYENQKVREGWAFFMNDKEAFDMALKMKGISRYSQAADALNVARRMKLLDYGMKNPEWWQEYTTLSTANSAVGYVRAMKTALNDEKFLNSLPDDSHWWNIQAILRERDALIEATKRAGLASPSKELREAYGRRIETYLQDPTTLYYFNKFLDNDGFDKD